MTTQHRNKLLFIIILALTMIWLAPTPKAGSDPNATVTYVKGRVELPTMPPKILLVDVALDYPAWQQGMMFRKSWGDIEGMLFIFPDEDERRFWMKNTYLPLDIVYLDHEARIVHIAAGAKPLDTTGVPSIEPAQMVLEIPAGAAKKYGLKTGDVLGIEH